MIKNSTKTLFITVLTFIIFASASFADSHTWSAYLIDSANNQLVRANHDGDFSIIELLISPEETTSSGMIEISPDGSTAAYCAYINHQNGISDYTLYVQDLTTNEIIFSQAYPEDICSVTAFNPEGTQYVVSSAPQYGVTPDDGIIWRIEVFDVMSNDIVHKLDSNDGLLDYSFAGEDIGFSAHVRHFDDNRVSFIAIPNIGMGLGATLPAYTWSFDGTVVESEGFEYVNGSYDVNNGFAFPTLNESMDYVQPGGPVPAANTVNVMLDGETTTVYTNTEWVVLNTTWINDGQDIAIMLLEGANTEDSFDVRYDIYNMETGLISELDMRYETYSQIANIPTGALIVWAEMLQTGDATTPMTYFGTVVDGEMMQESFAYESEFGSRGFAFLELIWTGQ